MRKKLSIVPKKYMKAVSGMESKISKELERLFMQDDFMIILEVITRVFKKENISKHGDFLIRLMSFLDCPPYKRRLALIFGVFVTRAIQSRKVSAAFWRHNYSADICHECLGAGLDYKLTSSGYKKFIAKTVNKVPNKINQMVEHIFTILDKLQGKGRFNGIVREINRTLKKLRLNSNAYSLRFIADVRGFSLPRNAVAYLAYLEQIAPKPRLYAKLVGKKGKPKAVGSLDEFDHVTGTKTKHKLFAPYKPCWACHGSGFAPKARCAISNV